MIDFKLITDSQGTQIDREILFAVEQFNFGGFITTASCAGHYDHGLPYPWIDFVANDKYRIEKLLSQFKYKLIMENIGLFGDFRLLANSQKRLAQNRKIINEFASFCKKALK